MSNNSLLNSISFVLKSPSNLIVLVKKIMVRLKGGVEKTRDLDWIKQNTTDFETWANSVDSNCWAESKSFSDTLKNDAKAILSSLPFSMGGGGIYPILYFLTILKKPKTIVETGVAAGYSSKTFLSAIAKNGFGDLYSSDFPYFRIPNPEKYIGILVDNDLRKNWHLFIKGDEVNLPQISKEVGSIDLFHYDSDKSYAGRTYAMDCLKDKLSKDALVVFDDIQDNDHFKDYVTNNKVDFRIFEFERKYIGFIGKL